jgi:hypothetical protein
VTHFQESEEPPKKNKRKNEISIKVSLKLHEIFKKNLQKAIETRIAT